MQENQIHYFMKPLVLINIVTIMGAEFLTPLWSKFSEHIGGDIRTAGIAVSIFAIIIGCFIMIAGRIEHHYKNEEDMMMLTSILMTFGYVGYLFVHHPWQLYLIEAYLGVTTAFQSPAIYSLYNRYMPKTHFAFHWGIWNGFYFIAFGTGALISVFIAHYFNFTAVFLGMIILSLITIILNFSLMPAIKRFKSQ